jgi:hypothetical protein
MMRRTIKRVVKVSNRGGREREDWDALLWIVFFP